MNISISLIDDNKQDVEKLKADLKQDYSEFFCIKETVITEILQDEIDIPELENFKFIIFHDTHPKDKQIKDFVNSKNIKYAIFSGGKDNVIIDNIKQLVTLKRKTLYDNIKYFLENYRLHNEINPFLLLYGPNEKKERILTLRELIYFELLEEKPKDNIKLNKKLSNYIEEFLNLTNISNKFNIEKIENSTIEQILNRVDEITNSQYLQ